MILRISLILISLLLACKPEALPVQDLDFPTNNTDTEFENVQGEEPAGVFTLSVPDSITVDDAAFGNWLDIEINNAQGDIDFEWAAPDAPGSVQFEVDRDDIPNINFARTGTYRITMKATDESKTVIKSEISITVVSTNAFEIGGYVLDDGTPIPFTALLYWKDNPDVIVSSAESDADGYFKFPNLLGSTQDFSVEIAAE